MSASALPRSAARIARLARAASAVLLVALLGLGSAPPAPAAPAAGSGDDAISWQIQPSSKDGPTTRPYFVYDSAPGASLSDYVGVSNLGSTSLSVSVYPSDGFNTADGAFDVRPASAKPVDVGAWITLAQRKITVAPRSRADVPFTLTVPPNATPGDHVGGIVASVTSVSADATGAQVAVERRIGARIYLSVTGPTTSSLRISEVDGSFGDAVNPFHLGSTTVRYTVTNTGNTRLAAHQQLKVSGPFGLGNWSQAMADLPELLPGSSVERSVDIDSPAAIRLTARLVLQPFRVANPAMAADGGSAIAARDTTQELAAVQARQGLWALAWWTFAGLAVVVVLSAWLARRLIGRAIARRRAASSADGVTTPAGP